MGLRKKHQNMKTTALYGASDSLVWIHRILHPGETFDALEQDNICYCGNQGENPPLLPATFAFLKNELASQCPIESEKKSEQKVKIVPLFEFHPLRA